ncbi:acid protease [Ganoderma leucocontextum]|nr:acid protease [Ganoderma leucocontextum]
MSSWRALVLLQFSLPALVSATTLFTLNSATKGGVVSFARSSGIRALDGNAVGGIVGLGDVNDLTYLVAVTVGNSTVSLNLDTGSSDLWAISNACQTDTCKTSSAQRYAVTKSFQQSQIGSVDLLFGDSTTGTHAAGPIAHDDVVFAGLTVPNQTFAAVNDTNNVAVSNGGAGILGLGFPSQSFVGQAAVASVFGNTAGTDNFIRQFVNYGPIVPRLILAGVLDQPLFTITLQRDQIDISGTGQLTVGQLPDGVDNSSLTWVPVRLYSSSEGGLSAPSFASSETYPLRWEIPLDGVYLDGEKLADTTEKANGISQPSLSALIDTGNSLIRGPSDVVSSVLSKVSTTYASNSSLSPLLPCTSAHRLAFQIGGTLFPVDPRDFITQNTAHDATTCVASNVVSTDAPSSGALFTWSLGDPFLKSTLVAFYYGNLTHPSADPPRIGFLSLVPDDAEELLQEAVQEAEADDGEFDSTTEAAPTSTSVIEASSPRTWDPAHGLPGGLATAAAGNSNAAVGLRGLSSRAVGRCSALLVLLSSLLSLSVL